MNLVRFVDTVRFVNMVEVAGEEEDAEMAEEEGEEADFLGTFQRAKGVAEGHAVNKMKTLS